MVKKNIYETDAVREFVATMSPLSRRKYFVARQVLQDVGYLRAPEGEKVAGEDNLYAITIHAPDNERVFYCYDDGTTIFMLHAYAKKTAKIPLREKATAIRIRKQLIGV